MQEFYWERDPKVADHEFKTGSRGCRTMKRESPGDDTPDPIQSVGLDKDNETDQGINLISTPKKKPFFVSEEARIKHGQKVSASLKEYYRRKQAGETPERKRPERAPTVSFPSLLAFGRCPGCNQLFALKSDLDTHSFFCEGLKQYRESAGYKSQLMLKGRNPRGDKHGWSDGEYLQHFRRSPPGYERGSLDRLFVGWFQAV
jgi:hypothetical protein